MKKFTLFLMSLFLSVGAMAQFTAGTGYRIKEKSTGLYLNVGGAGAHAYGEVYGSEKKDGDAANVQIFTFVDAGNGQYYVKSNSGEYITYTGGGQGWNVNGDSNESNAHSLTFESTGTTNEYKIKCYNQSKGANKYFKWEYVGASGKYHPFNDADAGAIFVVEQENLPVYTVTYKYSYNGVVVKTVTNDVTEGGSYPSADLGLYAASYEGTPEGTVTAAGEYTITVTVDEAAYPFEFAATYAEIGNKWYNLIMHSNWNTGAGAAKYRTYVGKDNGETLAWGTQRSLTNPSDDYFWAFVGDPINGFSVVNKGAGESYILSSNGTANPLLKEAANLPEGYNTTWSIATRKYDVSQEGDYILEGAWFCLKHTNGQYINANAGNGKVAFWTDNDNGSAILAVKPLEINEAADVATYYSANYITIPSTMGAEVYYVNNVENGYAKFAQITSEVIPAQTGVVVKFSTESNVVYAPEITSQGATTAVSGNLLKGTTKRTLIEKNGNACYVLGMTDGVGFYNAVNGTNEGEFYNGAYKAYLEIEGATETAAFYGFDWAGTTGIENVEVENASNVIYDLTGRRVEAITAPGIYIVNGKKVLVK
ncbi:MAG: hypothetical protein IIW75_00405 [Bacteroidaceae bacterium]|nr:hypothetical protein [Bacteroidaceae bacterium]